MVRELELIRRWCPRFNVKGHPGRLRRGYILLGRVPAPYAYVAHQPSGRDRLAIGPLRPSRALYRMVRILNDSFQLRDCAKQLRRAGCAGRSPGANADGRHSRPYDDFGCLRGQMGTCLGPCCGGCSSRQYADRVRAAAAFLRGTDLSALGRIERSMRAASAAEHFERAASFRDALAALGNLQAMLEELRTVRQTYSFVYPLPSYTGAPTWYCIDHGQVIAVAPAPTNRRSARECLKVLDRVYPTGVSKLGQEPPDDPDLVLIVSAWFRDYPDELHRIIPPDQARQQCSAKAAAAVRSA